MPAVSKAQYGKMFELHKAGKITDEQLANFTEGVEPDKLPERVGKPKTKQRHPFGGRIKK